MRRTTLGIALVVMLLFAVVDVRAQAPYRDARTSPTTSEVLRQPVIEEDPGYGFGSLLDPSRVSMNHQIGMGYSNFGGRGYSQGYYMNTISYRFNAPVLLRVRTGVTNNPFATSGSMSQPGQSALSTMFNNAEMFGGADLFWKPTENSLLRISFDRMPPGMLGYNRYGYGMGVMPGFYNRYGSPFGYEDPFAPYHN